MDIVVNEELKAYIDPLTPDEYQALERSLLAEGCRDALVLWGNVLVDGHNRYGICRKHGLPFQTVQNTRFQSMEDVHLWMIDQHLGRRSLSDFQRGVLALRKREIVAERHARQAPPPAPAADAAAPAAADAPVAAPAPSAEEALSTREALARAARLRSNQVQLIEKIQQSAAPEVVEAVKAGTLSLSAAAAVATLPAEEQVAAATAGKDELKQAAKRVREAKRKPPRDKAEAAEGEEGAPAAAAPSENEELLALRKRTAELETENAQLKREVATLRKQVLNLLGPSSAPAQADEPAVPAQADPSDPPF
ncbi:plasmid replication/partition related protein [Xenophilus arseniciresistens]|uniref:Plasmid replication/partition related protein n=1 Tax=Xenophilus arseniciresistens TaxID=1283306 RepID=A0AAE3SZ38_9BURK|nr:plasmid replication/partition related protein [Xenophilus arseniciresistens]MDA7414892.1 plasmid replication/partition related protein [Xenophilus arseniciresistens]